MTEKDSTRESCLICRHMLKGEEAWDLTTLVSLWGRKKQSIIQMTVSVKMVVVSLVVVFANMLSRTTSACLASNVHHLILCSHFQTLRTSFEKKKNMLLGNTSLGKWTNLQHENCPIRASYVIWANTAVSFKLLRDKYPIGATLSFCLWASSGASSCAKSTSM